MLWVVEQPRTRAIHDLMQAAHRVQALWSLADRCVGTLVQGSVRGRQGWRISVEIGPLQPDVWIVASNPGDAQVEKVRWERRGFRVALVSTLTTVPSSGLVVDLNQTSPTFLGRLPHHSEAGCMIQSWH